MTPDPKNWTVVIVGSWNTKIFNPRWISEKLLPNAEQQVQVLFPIVPGFPMVLSVDRIDIVPSEDSLVFRAKSADDFAVGQMEDAAVATLQILEHTPIRAIGANFGFEEVIPPNALSAVFTFADDEPLLRSELTARQQQLTRTFQMEGYVLNLTLAKQDETFSILANYHLALDYPNKLENALQAIDFIRGRLVTYKQEALSLLSTVYELRLEEAIT